MGVLAVIVFIGLLLAMTGNEFLMLSDVASDVRAQTRARDVEQVASEVNRYFRERGAYPSSLTVLASTDGFEHVKLSDTAAFNYVTTSGALTGSVFQYHRAAVVSQDYKRIVSDSDIFSATNNACASEDFHSAAIWCGRSIDRWKVSESKDFAPDMLVRQRALLSKTTRKLAMYYTANGSFPTNGGGTSAIASLAGYGGMSNSCTGVYAWNNIPFTCDDLFSVAGGQVTYTYITSKSIVIATDTGFTNPSGVSVILTMPIDLP